jgi:hypothetical protein
MSSARATYSALLPLSMAWRYRSMAFFIAETSRLHVRGGAPPSSKKDRGIVAAVGKLYVVLVKEVAEVIIGG